MLNKKLMILAIFIVSLLAVFTISSVSATDNLTDVTEEVLQETPSDDISLNYEGDELISSSSDEGGSDNVTLDESSQNDNLKDENDTKLFGALQNQINDAENDSTINLTNDYVGVGFGPDPTIIINKPLTINGNGHKLDAYSASGIFTITASNVFIYNVTFIRGYNNNGGAIYNSGENNTIDSCVFVDCTDSDLNAQDSSGGAIWNEYTGANFNVHSCTFSDCYSYNAGAIYNSAPDCTISSCVFVNCISENQGGAISNEGTCIINSSNFSYCSCDSDGGAIWFGGNGTVTNCNFTDNSALYGGAVYYAYDYFAQQSNFTVVNCNFINNAATSDAGEGGAIRCGGKGNVTNCNFINNTAGGRGGAIHILSGSVENCNFINNTAIKFYGGAIYFEYSGGIVSNCNFTNNSAPNYAGGAVYFYNKGYVKNSNFVNNTAKDYAGAIHIYSGTVENCNFANNNASNSYGGAVNFVDRGNVTNCNFTGNNATSRGGAICCNAVCFVTNCNFINNNATLGNGGALWAMAAKVVNCNFTDNFALHHGGACWIYSGIVSGSDFIGNDVVTGSGGALRFTEEGDVTNCNFTNNSAIRGGAVGFNGKGDLTNCNFNNNWAISDYGGAAYFYFKANVTNCSFADNEAATYGGAVFFDSFANVTNCNFVSNKVASRDGGAVCFNSSGALSNCNFAGNSAGLRGGAVYFYINSTVENCNFTGNTASNGGAIHTSQMCYGIVAGCDFANNSAFNGGAVNMYAGVIEDCNFANNTATNAGGAVIFSEEGCLAHCNFEGNTAFIGGAISMFSGNLNNCNFTGNNATKGSAINFNGFSGTNISNSLFLNNRANASATDAFNVTVNGNSVVIAFIGQNNLLNAIYSKGNISFTNVTYWGAGGIVNTGVDPRILSPSSCEAGQNVSVIGVVNGNIINATMITDENGRIVLENGSDYYLALRHDADSYYALAETISTNMKLYVNVASLMTTSMTVNITAKSNIYSEVMPGELIFILPNVNVTANYSSSGIWWAVYTFADYGVYEVNASYIGLDNVTVSNATIGVKIKTEVTADEVTATYNKNKNLVVTLRDANGNPLSGVKVTINLNGAKTYTTDSNGQVKVSTKGLAPKAYTAKIAFSGDAKYFKSAIDVKVIVKKATPKLTAKKKTFKKSKKVKKYTVTLKSNVGKAMKKVKLTIKIGKKTYKATTNSKGKVTFKIKKLSKKGKYKATIKYKGDKYYNKVTKKVKITVK